MVTKKGITVDHVISNEVYDIYEVRGVHKVEEDGEPIYHKTLRNQGYTENDVLQDYIN